MPINNISLSNTFGQLVTTVQSILTSLNLLETSNYSKTSGTLTISSSGTGLDVQSDANFQASTRFYANTQFDTWITATNIRVSESSTLSGISFTPTKLSILGSSTIPFTAAFVVNRGEATTPSTANAEIRWNETNSYWDIRDVNNPSNYHKIITKSDYATTSANGIVTLNTTVTSTADNLAATPSTVKYVYDIATNTFGVANNAQSYAISAFGVANNAQSYAVSGFVAANSSNSVAVSAFNTANIANNRISNTYYFTTTSAANKTLANRERCFITANNIEVTLPASPSNNHSCIVGVENFTNTIIKNNGTNIRRVNDTFRIDVANVTITFTYVDSRIGWFVE